MRISIYRLRTGRSGAGLVLRGTLLLGLPHCSREETVCSEGAAELLPDGASAVYVRSWCPPMILDLPPIARQELVYLSLETDSERVLPRSPGAPSMRFIVGRVGVSSDGRYVAANAQFDAADADPHRRQRLVLHDLEANVATEIDLRPLMGEGLGSNAGPGLSTNAAIIVFGYNSVGDERIFAFTRDAESFEEVSVDDGGASLGFSFEPQISDDGRIVVFGSRSSLLAGTSQVYVRDRLAGTVEIVSVNEAGEPADQPCRLLALSGDGRFVAFASSATNIVGDAELPGESVFLADLTTRELSRLPAAGDFTGWGAFSADGEYLAFPGTLAEDNGFTDVLLYRHSTGQVRRISVDTDGNEGDEMSDSPSISNDGAVVMFRSDATNLLSEPSVGSTVSAWYVYDTAVGTLRRVRINDIG